MMVFTIYYKINQGKIIMSATALEKEGLPQALTSLTEEEELFRASVREFAEGEVLPRV